ncbi:MAG: hypothetical protein N2512_02030, partial [Armatimonadetes bacterium]|nr:hypothetical protein [Armatimonadota bacterium]
MHRGSRNRQELSRGLAAVLAAMVAMMLAGAGRAEMTIAEQGQPRATIVIGADHSRTDEWCARELQTWLEEITGARLPIVTDDTPVDG